MARIKFNSSTLTLDEAFEKFLFSKNAQGVKEKTLIGYENHLHCISRKKTIDVFKNELLEKNPGIELVGDYLGTHTNTRFHCKKCGNEWCAMPNNILRGHGCPVCARERTISAKKKSNSMFLSQLSTIAPNGIYPM